MIKTEGKRDVEAFRELHREFSERFYDHHYGDGDWKKGNIKPTIHLGLQDLQINIQQMEESDSYRVSRSGMDLFINKLASYESLYVSNRIKLPQ